MAVTRTTSVFRPDGGGDDNRGSRRYNPRTGVKTGGRRLKVSSNIESGSGATKCGGSGKFFLVGAVLAIQFIGAAAKSRGNDIQVDFTVPSEAVVGSSVEMTCEWQLLGEDGLYSVKWYKDDHEFFRYMPDTELKSLVFSQPGINVDEEKSNSERFVKLKNLVLASSGQYKCEVSTEGPSFATSYKTGNLTVILLPEKGPEITGLSSHYADGENVTATCTSWPSVPKANLRWTINGEPVPFENTLQLPPLPSYKDSGTPNSLGLLIEAKSWHFEGGGGLVKIKCISEVGSRVFEAERRVLMAYVNNQRLSAGDHLHAAVGSIRAGLLVPLTVFALVMLTT